MVLLHTRAGTLGATTFAMLLAWYLHGAVPAWQVEAWLLAKVVLAGARIGLAMAYQRRRLDQNDSARWQRAMLALLALDGLIWGIAGWRMMGEPLPMMALAVAALDGVSCVATFGLQVRLSATAAYILPMLLPAALGLAQRPDGISVMGAGSQLILAGVLLGTARGTSKRLTSGMVLRLQAHTLVAQKDAALLQAREQREERSRFMAKVSHELRTPLHGILGLARLLHLEARDPTVTRRLELIESSGTHLLGLINDLLEVSRMGSGHFSMQQAAFDLRAELGQLSGVFALRASDKGLRFELQADLPEPCWVHGDAARLHQVLSNLLANAVKFTRQGTITLQVGQAGRAEHLRFSVRDTGQGIGVAEQSRIFHPFHQSGSGRATDGVGLGLTIAREIAQAMGGDIEVESGPGQGACFSFEAWLPAVAAGVAPLPQPAPSARLPRLVLVAEDDDVNALIVNAYLDSLGVMCERVADGKQAVSRALRETDRPDLVLMDCRMPVMDGMSAAAEIRRQERTLGLPRLPILALTATTTDADRQACLDAGMDDMVAKPFTPEQLAQAMRDGQRGLLT